MSNLGLKYSIKIMGDDNKVHEIILYEHQFTSQQVVTDMKLNTAIMNCYFDLKEMQEHEWKTNKQIIRQLEGNYDSFRIQVSCLAGEFIADTDNLALNFIDYRDNNDFIKK